jgi:hypothetical protein
MQRPSLHVVAAALLAGAPAAAQDGSGQTITDPAALASAAKNLAGQAADRFLVRDLLGQKLTGVDGNTVGTVRNLVVVPGGRIVAVLVETGDGTRLAVPFTAVKLAGSGSAAPLSATVSASELKGMQELKSLAQSLGP